jgi:hypothetical protein
MSEPGLTIYECSEIIERIEAIAKANDGEITDEQLKELVEAQTTSLAKLSNLCGFMKHLEGGISLCETEIARINAMRRKAKSRLENIKRFLLPYLQAKGKRQTIGTFTLSTRKSTSTEVDEEWFFSQADAKSYCRHIPERWEPDKAAIKKHLQDGVEINGCTLVEKRTVMLR